MLHVADEFVIVGFFDGLRLFFFSHPLQISLMNPKLLIRLIHITHTTMMTNLLVLREVREMLGHLRLAHHVVFLPLLSYSRGELLTVSTRLILLPTRFCWSRARIALGFPSS